MVGPISAHEDRLQPIVIDLGNRIELVIVTPRAFHRQSHGRRRHDLDRVVESLVEVAGAHLGLGKLRPACVRGTPQKACRDDGLEDFGGQLLLRFISAPVVDQLVSRQLLLKEAVVGLVLIERADDVVAIAPGGASRRVRIQDPFGVRVARQIQPMAAPAFAVMRAGEVAVDQSLIGVRAAHRPGKRRSRRAMAASPSSQRPPAGSRSFDPPPATAKAPFSPGWPG